MFHRRVVAAVTSVVAFTCPVAPHAQSLQRSMYVTVVDRNGDPVADLGPADFVIREDNAAREVLSVTAADEPMQVAIMVDNSTASHSFIRDIRTGLEGFVTDMTNGTKNELSIIALAERPTILTGATTDRAKLLKGVTRVFDQSNSANYLLDGIIEVCQGFTKREARRPVIVAVTTEGPEYSSRQYQDVFEPLRKTGAAFHVITLGRPNEALSDEGRNRARVLDQGPQISGGARETLLAGSALPGALTRLASQLKHQYRVTYARPQTLIPPEKITVSAAKPDLTARGTPVHEPQSQERR